MDFARYLPVGKIEMDQGDLLGLAWLCEQSACWQRQLGKFAWSAQLFENANQLRAQAVNQ